MAIAANTGSGEAGIPFAKLTRIGDTLVASFGGGVRRQQRKFDSGEPAFKKDGKTPALEEVMYLVAMPGTAGAVTGNLDKPDTIKPIVPGDTVRYSVSGFKWGQLIEARKALPAYAGVGSGVEASGDVVTFSLTGYSAATENPVAASQAGFMVVEGRIVMSTEDERDRWALAQLRSGRPANAGKDILIAVRRPRPDEAQWEQQGDALFSSKPWERKEAALMMSGGPGPFDDAPAAGGIDRSQMF